MAALAGVDGWLSWACRSWSGRRASRSWPRPPARCSPSDRDWATAAAVTAAVLGGAHIVRVHAVEKMIHVVSVADALRLAAGRP